MTSRIGRFQSLVDRQPENELFRFSLAEALYAEHRAADAIPHLEFCVRRKQDWMMPRILLGKALLETGRRGEAGSVLGEALKLAIDQHHEDPERELRAILGDL